MVKFRGPPTRSQRAIESHWPLVVVFLAFWLLITFLNVGLRLRDRDWIGAGFAGVTIVVVPTLYFTNRATRDFVRRWDRQHAPTATRPTASRPSPSMPAEDAGDAAVRPAAPDASASAVGGAPIS